MPDEDPEWLEVCCVVGVVIIADIGTREVDGIEGLLSTLGEALAGGADAEAKAGEGAAEGPGAVTRGVAADSLLTLAPATEDAALDSAAFA